jgi:hypothetical protein
MKIEDLSPYNYMRHNESVKSVGWLEGDYPKGYVDPNVIELLEKYPIINKCRGSHEREYCGESLGNGEIWTVGEHGVYAAPTLLIHYIKEHNYLPPSEFIDSVLNGPRPDTDVYKNMISSAKMKSTAKPSTYKEDYDKFVNKQAKELSADIDAKIIQDILNDKTW